MVEIERLFEIPGKSFFLFGPRGTGKSTLLRKKLVAHLEINLLKSSQFIPLSQNPSLIQDWTHHLKKGQWVFIDEVQKIPSLLDEVHLLYEEKRLNFALSGSSARKLKRGGANLLAGRALQNFLYPLTYNEFRKHMSIDEAIEWGSLPLVVTDRKNRVETLATYVETYLRQELIEEGLVRKLEPFSRFLKVAGIYNGQILNVENIARESSLGRTTVDKYFEIIEDTLIGYRLSALRLNLKSKESAHPKFYLFDSGVARACASLLSEPLDQMWKGFAFETFLLNEIRAYNDYFKKRKDLYYYRVLGGHEVDLLIEVGKRTLNKKAEYLALEFKLSKTWNAQWSSKLSEFANQSGVVVRKAIGIYCGERILTQKGVVIFPIKIFLEKLYSGDFF